MAAITTAAVVAAGATVYSANRQSAAAQDAADAQARGVEEARADTLSATDRARAALGPAYQTPLATNNQSAPPNPFDGLVFPDGATPEGPIQNPTQVTQGVDPRSELLTGIGASTQLANQGFGQAEETLSPLAQMAQPYVDEQYNLLGLGGDAAYQQALSNVADPLAAEQERAILRNNAALGGVGGNVLSQLAEQTRSRTEANIGNRLSQLSSASSPALAALQNQANIQQNRGLSLSGILGQGGAALADQETNRRNSLANIEIGQGTQLSQLSQNLGNANAGASAYAAQNSPALSQGIMSGLSAYMGAGGNFGANSYPTQSQFNSSAGYTFDSDPFGG